MLNNNNLKNILLIIIILISGFFLYNQYELNNNHKKIIEINNEKIIQNDLMIQKVDSLINKQRDTLKTIQKTINNYYEQKVEQQNEITNTENIDTLIILYYKYKGLLTNKLDTLLR